jgi:gliding motility-associated protein GldE
LDITLEIVAIVVLLFFSATFSGSETAFFSLSEVELETLRRKRPLKKVDKLLLKLESNRQRLLVNILIGNTLVNVAIASTAALLAKKLLLTPIMNGTITESEALIAEVAVITVVLLILGEIIPKVYAINNSLGFARRTAVIIRGGCAFFDPLARLLDRMLSAFASKTGNGKTPLVTTEELKTAIELGQRHGVIEESEKAMIKGVFDFSSALVREVMTPRIDMVVLDDGVSVTEAIAKIKESGHSRIPAFREDIDNIAGVLYAKDLAGLRAQDDRDKSIRPLLRDALFVPETKKVDELLEELQKKKVHLAIAVDEYGGTAGLVTIEDLIEEIVGEIRDEYDTEVPLYTVMEDDTVMVDARIDIQDLNELISTDLPADRFDTLGGYLYDVVGRIPDQGERIEADGAVFVIEKIEGQRISVVRVIKVSSDESEEER